MPELTFWERVIEVLKSFTNVANLFVWGCFLVIGFIVGAIIF